MSLRTAADWNRVIALQRERATSIFGRDNVASSNAGFIIPFTPREYADLVYSDWGGTYHECVRKEAETYDNGIGVALAAAAKAQKRLLNPGDIEQIRVLRTLPFTEAMTNSLRLAFTAYSGGGLVRTQAGVNVLNSASCEAFWRNTGAYVANASITNAVVVEPSRWSSFSTAMEAVKEGGEAVGDAVGRVAGHIAETAGRTLGSGVSGFIGELGFVNMVVVMGAGFVALKVL